MVVIAIIAILASMLLPTLGKARAKARAIACVSNMKQDMLYIAMYVDDNDGIMPTHYYKAKDGKSFWTWADHLYLAGLTTTENKAAQCPAAPSTLHTYTDNDAQKDAMTAIYGTTMNMSNSYFWFKEGGVKDKVGWFRPAGDATNPVYFDSRQNGTPGATIFLMDSVYLDTHQQSWCCYRDSTDYVISMRHGRRANFSFADGHVQTMSPSEFCSLRDADSNMYIGSTYKWVYAYEGEVLSSGTGVH